MVTLYVASMAEFAGKTSLSIALGKHLQREGYNVGYMRPITTRVRRVDDPAVAQDAEFVRLELALDETLEDIVPIALTLELVEEAMRGGQTPDFRARLQAAYERVAEDKDVLILEGGSNWLEGALLDLSSPQIAELLDARVLVIIKYDDHLAIDTAAGLRLTYGDRLLGVVFNAVPRTSMHFVQVATPALEQRGIPVLGVLPDDRLLSSISVAELANHLRGQVVCCEDQTEGLVEYLMVGAMTAGSALAYFRSRPNKAVITGGDRHDVQLAALETSTRCLILTGNQAPSTVVLNRAKEVGVPIIVVAPDTLTTVRNIERIFGKTFVREPRKSARFGAVLEERFDFTRLYHSLGLEA